MINSRFLDGMTIEEAKEEVARRLERRLRAAIVPVAIRQVNFRLRDWGISRQRYWGCPIPVIHCERCGIVPVPERELPVKLPDDVEFDRPGNPLDRHPTWKHVACPTCGAPARRETDTMDTFVDSSWYFARFTDPWIETAPTDRQQVASLAAGRPIYRRHRARDPASALFSASSPAPCGATGHVDLDEPFAGLFTQGMVVHETYQTAGGEWVTPAEVKIEGAGDKRNATLIATGEPVEIGAIEKMSKSKRNTVDPDDIIGTYGADTARWFMLSELAAGARRDLDRGGRAGRLAHSCSGSGGWCTRPARWRHPPARRGRRYSASRRWRYARPRTAPSRTSPRISSGCASTYASPTSTSSPTPSRPRCRASRLSQWPTIAGRCARRSISWSGCFTP